MRRPLVYALSLCIFVILYYALRPEVPLKAPNWDKLKDWQNALPQHNLSLPYPEGANGRFVRFSVQSQRIGWNNHLAELLMNAHLAHETYRAFVFPHFQWATQHYPFAESDSSEWPPVTPLNALISGPVVGGLWEEGDDTPRAISHDWFDIACPHSDVLVLNASRMREYRSGYDGARMFEEYKQIIRDAPQRCIDIRQDIDNELPQLFDLWLWGDPRLLSLWDSFSRSPVSRLLGVSPIVKNALDRNMHLFQPRGPRPFAWFRQSDPIKNLLAVHLRRGDYSEACQSFFQFDARFNGWNQLEFLQDRLYLPDDFTERQETYRRRCSPDIDEIVGKIEQARRGYEDAPIESIYVMTNEKGEWLDELLRVLRAAGWKSIRTSRDIELRTGEEVETAMVLDMEIAKQAGIFIGNGWSSFTSNIVHNRLVSGKAPMSIRFF